MKRVALAILILTLAGSAYAGWTRTYGDEGYDVGNCVQLTSDGNYVITGAKWVFLKVDTSGVVLSSRYYEGFIGKWIEETPEGDFIIASWSPSLLKTTLQGDTLWSKDYDTYSYCVQPTSDGGYIVVGGDNGYESDSYLILVKTDSNGDTVWTRTYGDGVSNFYGGFFIQETHDNSYVITGLRVIVDGEWFSMGLMLMKTDSIGDTLWTRTYGGVEYEEYNKGYCVRETSDSGFVVTGYRRTSLWLLKTDSIGDTLWTKTYRTSSGGVGYSVQETADSGYVIMGTTESLLATSSPVERDLWFLKTDEQGDTMWSRKYPGGGNEAIGHCIQQTEDKGYVVVGELNGDIYLLKTDSLGLLAVEEKPMPAVSVDWKVVTSLGAQIVLRYSDMPQGFHASIFDVTGKKVDELHSTMPDGVLKWGSNHNPGVYFVVPLARGCSRAQKVVLVK